MVKKFIFIQFLIGFVFIQNVSSQNDKTTQDDHIELIIVVDSWPELNKKGPIGLVNFIVENVREIDVPEDAKRVVVDFLVDTLGYTSNHKIIRGFNDELDNEALRVSRLLKFECPAMQRGKPVNITYTIAFDFKKILLDKKKAEDKMKRQRKKRK